MKESRATNIKFLAADGKLSELQDFLETGYTQLEINIALENAITYSKIETAEYLISLGADLTNYDYRGTFNAVHNNELEGLKFAVDNGVDINVSNGRLLNTSILTAYNKKDATIFKWLLANGADVVYLSDDIMNAFGTDDLKRIIKHHTTPLRKI